MLYFKYFLYSFFFFLSENILSVFFRILDLLFKFQALLSLGFLTTSVPLPPLPPSDSDPTGCLSWLDRQRPHSMSYVSFGILNSLSEKELIATADALEESEVPFLWSLPNYYQVGYWREPQGMIINEERLWLGPTRFKFWNIVRRVFTSRIAVKTR